MSNECIRIIACLGLNSNGSVFNAEWEEEEAKDAGEGGQIQEEGFQVLGKFGLAASKFGERGVGPTCYLLVGSLVVHGWTPVAVSAC